MIGLKIPYYEIKSLLGEGGMGNVYLAEHTQLGRKVAIKSLHQQLVKNEGLRARFKNEASTMAHLQHPKIVALYDYVEESDGLYLIMEYVEGLPLDEYIKDKSGPIPAETAVPMMTQILDAFSYAHSKGIIHRDIKPSNILITQNGDIKILDFGIAKMMSEAGNKLTKTGTQMGTVFYMSPEQVQGKEIDIRSDIYSLGVTFYQMLTGISPYDGMTTEFEVYSKIVSEPLPKASILYPGVPDYLDFVISKATTKNKDERFQNCEEFLNALNSNKIDLTLVTQKPETKPVVNNSIQRNESKERTFLLPGILLVIFTLISLLMYSNYKWENYSGYQDSGEYYYDTTNYFIDTAAAVSQSPYSEEKTTTEEYLTPPIEEELTYNDDENASANQKVVVFNNNSYYTISLAYAFYDRGWETQGWYNMEPGKSTTITLPSTFNDNNIYWYAENNNNARYEGYDGYFCTSSDAFHYYIIDDNCDQKRGFYKLNLTGSYTVHNLGH